MSFEPKIVGFLCNWCSYAGADLAGVSRLKCAPNVYTIRTMCSGGLDPFFVLKALEAGADGVLICGCNPGDCHYREGNYKALRRITLLKKMLEQLGIEPERVQLHWVCASCGDEFVDVVNKITAEIKELGPIYGGTEETRFERKKRQNTLKFQKERKGGIRCQSGSV